MRRRRLLALACLLAAAVAATPAAAAQRLALVVGNAAYAGHPLPTTADDAGLVAQALAQAGYEVTAARDLDGKALRATLHAFIDSARDAGPDATILVYLAGLGVQYDGNNYMLPVDAALAHDDDVPLQGADLGDFSRGLAGAPAKARVLLYDLTRDSPLAPTDEMPLAPGLALVAPAKDTIVGFAAAPGQVAPPAALPYGPYARALAEALGPRMAEGPSAMLERVRLRVATLTNGGQVPWNAGAVSSDNGPASSLDRLPAGDRSPDLAFAAVLARDSLEGYSDFLRAVPDGPLAARVRVLLALRREATMWHAVAGSDDPRAAWTYMRRYPRGPHRFDARRRLAALKAQLEPPPRFDLLAFADVSPPAEGEGALVAHPREALRGLPPIPAPPEALLPRAAAAYFDDLPMPTPAPRDLLPITRPLPQDPAIEPGRITQTGTTGETSTETYVAPNGASTLTLSDDKGPFLIFATRTDAAGARITAETGPKGDVKSRTTTTQAGDATTIVLADPAGATLMKMATRGDPDGGRTTRVTDGDGTLVAGWRRDPAGVVVVTDTSGEPTRPAAAVAAPVPAAPSSPTIAIPVPPKPAPDAASIAPPTGPSAETAPPRKTPTAKAPAAPPPKASLPPAPTPPAPTQPAPAPPAPMTPRPATPSAPGPAPGAEPHAPPAVPAPAAPAPTSPAASPPATPAPEPPAAPPPPPPEAPPPTPPAATLRVPLPPPRPAAATPRERKSTGKGVRKPAASAKAHGKAASRPAKTRPMPRRKGRGTR